jgi:hypothetical protein
VIHALFEIDGAQGGFGLLEPLICRKAAINQRQFDIVKRHRAR